VTAFRHRSEVRQWIAANKRQTVGAAFEKIANGKRILLI
jgi:hypothetical protein